jgi:hypothetical protein
VPDDRIPRRILALLDKAASTEFEAEAEAATAKALALMARHHVDEAVLEARREAGDPSGIVEEVVDLGRGPYVNGRLALLTHVCEAFSVRCLTSVTPDGRVGHVIGHRPDVGRALLLYTSLHQQAATRVLEASPRPHGRSPRPASSVIRFRRAFLFGFAAQVAERLAAATAEAVDDGPTSAALVLADRTARVDAWVRRAHGRVGTHRATAPAGAGWDAGEAAGRAADLGTVAGVPAPAPALRR